MTSTHPIRFVAARSIRFANNIRPTISNDAIASMKASIMANGLMQNLVLAPVAAGSEQLAVVAGATRLTAILDLIATGDLAENYEVAAMVRDDVISGDIESLVLALSENIIRTSMDYVDECAAMLALAKGGKGEAEIAGLFGYRPRTVRERLLIAGLIPQALDLMRSGDRGMEWARALTMADHTFQTRIVQDIASNPNVWREGADIRAHLTRSTIPASHAIFDTKDYTSALVADFFEGDKFADIGAFWKLQNEAVDGKVADLEGQGYKVSVMRNEPFPDWLYADAAKGVKGEAIVEVMADGQVRVFEGKVLLKNDTTDYDAEGGGLSSTTSIDEIGVAPWEVRPMGRVLDYAAAQKSAILQAKLAGDFEASLRYATLTLMGAQGGAFSAQAFTFPGAASIRNGNVWNHVGVAAAEEQAIRDIDPQMVALVVAMDRPALETLFSAVVARRAGLRRNTPDASGNSIPNALARDVDVRSWWTPDAAFFNLLPGSDLRRLCTALVPRTTVYQAAKMSRKALVRSLDGAFDRARNGLWDPVNNERLNTWVPGVMSFPAIIEQSHTAQQDEAIAIDADQALFAAF